MIANEPDYRSREVTDQCPSLRQRLSVRLKSHSNPDINSEPERHYFLCYNVSLSKLLSFIYKPTADTGCLVRG